MIRFEGRNILVTGGSSGIGAATARALAHEGARVAITGRDAAALEAVRASLGAGAIALPGDTADIASFDALAARIEARLGRLDGIFINAGTAQFGPFETMDEARWDASFDTNVKGPYFLIQKLRPLLNRGASILLNGSVNAHLGMPGSSVYAASKVALMSLARTLSTELLPLGARVNVISPGPVTTPLYGKLGLNTDQLQAMAEHVKSQVPLGRFGTPEEIASTVLHLLAPESAFVVGSELLVDGGMVSL